MQSRKEMLAFNTDIRFFEAAYAAACKGEMVFVTDFIHPTGILPMPDGRRCITEREVHALRSKAVQRLKPDVVVLLRRWPMQIKAAIVIDIVQDWKMYAEADATFKNIKRAFAECDIPDCKETIARDLLAFVDGVCLEAEYGEDAFLREVER